VIAAGGIFYSRLYLREEALVEDGASSFCWVKVVLLNENCPKAKVDYLKTNPEIRDGDGLKLAKVEEIDSKKTGLTHVVSSDKLYILRVNPENLEIKASIDLYCKKEADGYFYNNERLVVGKELMLDFGFCTFEGTVLSIQNDIKTIR